MGVVLSPLAFGVSNLLVNLTARFTDDALPPANTGFAVTTILFFLMTSSVAYFVSKIGRPAFVADGMMMETLSQNLHEIEEIINGRLGRLGGEGSCRFDIDAAQDAGILSQDQAARLQQMLQLQHARSVLHEDVELWVGKSRELLDELTMQLPANCEPTIAAKQRDQRTRENGNPYAPPYRDSRFH